MSECPEILTGVDHAPPSSGVLALEVHPNPFNPATTIGYEIATAGPASLVVYDVTGSRVATLFENEHRNRGRYSISYEARTVSGVYFARLTSGGESTIRKIVLLK